MYEHPSQLKTVGEILDLIQQLQDEKDSAGITTRAKNVGIEFIKIAMGEIPIVGGALGAADGLFAMYQAGKNEEHTWAELEEYPILARMKMHPDVAKHLDPITLREIDKAYQQYLSTLGRETRVTDIKDVDVFARDWIMADTSGNLNVELLREYVRVLLREANEYKWSVASKKNMLLDKEGMEQKDKDNQEEFLKSMSLMEAARGPADLGDMKIYVSRDQGDIELWLVDELEIESAKNQWKRLDLGSIMNRASVGIFSAVPADDNCLNGYTVTWAHVDDEYKGWGPMLYDLAMEIATSEGSGLLSDRKNVSAEAARVWKHYASNRGDVETEQLDDWDGNLTPENDLDDCDDEIVYMGQGLDSGNFWDPENEETPWDPYGKEILLQSPLAKLYKSNGTPTLNMLKDMDKLEML